MQNPWNEIKFLAETSNFPPMLVIQIWEVSIYVHVRLNDLVNHSTKSDVGLWQDIPHVSNISNTSRPISSHSLLSISPFPHTVCYIWNKHLIYIPVGVIMMLQQRGSYRTKVAANPNSIADSAVENNFRLLPTVSQVDLSDWQLHVRWLHMIL